MLVTVCEIVTVSATVSLSLVTFGVTVCGVLQFVVVKVRLAGSKETSAAPVPPGVLAVTARLTVTFAEGGPFILTV